MMKEGEKSASKRRSRCEGKGDNGGGASGEGLGRWYGRCEKVLGEEREELGKGTVGRTEKEGKGERLLG
jgi:hypothetical protein